jgi:hydroxyacylglutathione hydrolase
VKLVESELVAVVKHFGFDKWTKGVAVIDLGGRELTPYPIPGHQEASIAVSDPHTQWLLTGDTFYPGRLYVREWGEYKISIQHLVDFTGTHPVTALMVTHIEATGTAGEIFDFGVDCQPNEVALSFTTDDLNTFNAALFELSENHKREH